MSVLDNFLILLQVDGSGLKKGADDTANATKKIEHDLTATDKIVGKLSEHLKRMATEFGGALVAYAGFHAIVEGIKQASEYANSLYEVSEATGLSVASLDSWGTAITKNGGSAEEFQSTVKMLSKSLADLDVKGKDRLTPFFKELKINFKDAKGQVKDAISILPEFAKAFEGMSKTKSFGIGQKLGLDESTIRLLQQGRKAVEDVIAREKELGVVTKQDTEIAHKYNVQWDDTAHAFRSLFTAINSTVLPVLSDILKGFEKVAVFFRRHSDLIVGGIIAIGTALTVYLLPALIKSLVAFGPFLLIGLAIAAVGTAFALVYEDVVAFYKGNKSLLGELINRWPIVGNILKGIETFVRSLILAFKMLGMGVSEAWNAIISGITKAMHGILIAIDKILAAYHAVKKFLGLGEETKIDVTGATAPQNQETLKAITAGKLAISTANSTPLNSQTSNSISSSSAASSKTTTVNTGDIHIQTQATSSGDIAGAIADSLKVQLRHATNSMDDGVAA